MVAGYRALGWDVPAPPATMYIWARVPAAWGDDDFAFITRGLRKIRRAAFAGQRLRGPRQGLRPHFAGHRRRQDRPGHGTAGRRADLNWK